MTLFDQALNQRLRFARALSPYDMVTGANYSGEIKVVRIKLLRHCLMPLVGSPQTGHPCSTVSGKLAPFLAHRSRALRLRSSPANALPRDQSISAFVWSPGGRRCFRGRGP